MTLEMDIVNLIFNIFFMSFSYGLRLILIHVLIKRNNIDATYKTSFIVNGTFLLFGFLIGDLYTFTIFRITRNLPIASYTTFYIYWSALNILIGIFVMMMLLKLFYRDTYKHGFFVGVVVNSIATFIYLILNHLKALLFTVLTGGRLYFLLI